MFSRFRPSSKRTARARLLDIARYLRYEQGFVVYKVAVVNLLRKCCGRRSNLLERVTNVREQVPGI